MTALAIILIVYGIAVIAIAIWKPAPIWNMKKIQGFVSVFKETGTMIFFIVWALIAIAVGIVLLV
jgi:hypothetical protein